MCDILTIINNLTDRLWKEFGNPLAKYNKTQNDIHMTHYVGRLMEELGHKWVNPKSIKGEHEDRAYYSESALHDAFLAGQLLAKGDRDKMRAELIRELRAEVMYAVENLDLR
jgi:hypothetical protein